MKFSRKVDKPLILYGAGKLGRLAAEVMQSLGILYLVLDKNDTLGFTPDKIHVDRRKNYLVAVCVTTEPYYPIKRSLLSLGYEDIVPIYDIFNAYPECGITNGWTFTDSKLFTGFSDEKSMLHYAEFWRWRCLHTEAVEGWASWPMEHDRYYIPEVTALTSTRFQEEGSTLAEIAARRQVVKLTQPQDYIGLHLEGCELATLRKNRAWLQKHRPILAVCCYHTRDGLYKIPKWCADNLEGYRLLFRCHAYMGQAAVLYCIPNERKPA